MNKSLILIVTFIALLSAFSISVEAQNNLRENAPDQPTRGGNLMRMLGLSKDQIQQIRRMNAARKPLEREAQQKIQLAKENLDAAVYSDTLNESNVRAGLLELQQAQAELIQIKATHELEIRKLLTAEQLIKFRELRQEFEERKKERIERRQNRLNNAPNRRQPNRQRP